MRRNMVRQRLFALAISMVMLFNFVGGPLTTIAHAETSTENLLGQITFPDTTSISNMVDITNGTHSIEFDNGKAHLMATAETGDVLYMYDESATVTANGVTTVEISTENSWRCGVMIRTTDASNYTWIGFDNSTTLRIRETISGASSDLLVQIATMPTTFELRVEYWNDTIQVYANDNMIYDGLRPRANEADNNVIVQGKSGVMAWSIHDVAYDNLSVYAYAPTVVGVEAVDATATIDGHNVSLVFPYGTNLSEITPSFTTSPQEGVTITPDTAQDFANGATINYTLSLAGGGSNTYTVTASCAPMSVYMNTFDGNGDTTLIQSMTNVGDTTNTITHVDDAVTVISNTGNDLYIDMASPSVNNGVATVDYTNNDQWRSGIMIRATDSNNFTWIALESATSLRMRESIDGVQRDVIQTVSLPGNAFKLKVYFYGDELLVYAGDALIYNGVRPFKYGSNPIEVAPIAGKIGVMGWSVKNATFDNLSVSGPVPIIIQGGSDAGNATINGDTIQYTLEGGADITAFTPVFETFPSNATVSPAGAQDFSGYDAQTQGILYTVSLNDSLSTYRVFVSTQEDTLYTLTNDVMTVRFNKLFPAVYDYSFANSSGAAFKGSNLSYSDSIKINDVSYIPAVEFSTVGSDTVKYKVSLANVTVGNVTGKTVTFVCTYTLTGNDVVMKITDVTGDETNSRFLITIDSPIITLPATNAGASITTGGSGGSGGDGGTAAIASNAINKSSLSYAFLNDDVAAATVYTSDQWNRPYIAKTVGSGSSKVGLIYSTGFQYRLADGAQPVKDVAVGTTEVIPYVQTIHICQDSNADGAVTWQDAALWTRTMIPQMPTGVRNFFNGGSWVQTHAAFPGNGNNGSSAVNNYSGFTTVYSEVDQLLEAQRQIYNMTDGIGKTSIEVVGWNGRGHDYGWPSINEVTFNPALGTEEEYRAAQVTIKEYGGDLSFHTNMTDMCENSDAYLRGTTDSIYGNRNSSTGTVQYNSSVFGWTAYKNNHYTDLPFALNRENAFIGTMENVGTEGRFHAPQFMYSDVMLDYPKGNYTAVEEQYAKYRLVNHYESLGTNLATEYYYSEKRTGGLYLMKNYSNPNVVDQFINAGQTIFNDTRNVAVQTQDYIWADIYSDVNRDGNANITGSGSGNQLSNSHTELTFLLSYLNGFVSKNTLVGYKDEGTAKYTLWSNGVKFAANTANGTLSVTENGVAIANLTLTSGKISGDSFIPAYDGSNRLFTFSTNGGNKTWTVPTYVGANEFELYRLTENGRVFVGSVAMQNGTVSFAMEPGVAYVLDYSGNQVTAVTENLTLTSTVTASSNQTKALWNTYITSAPVPSESLYVSKTDGSAWQVSNDSLLKNLTTRMLMDGDATQLRYFRFVVSGFAADGVDDTYWMPETGSTHWINFGYTGARTVSSVAIRHNSSVDNLSIILTGTKTDGSTVTLYSGMIGKNFTKTLDSAVSGIVSTKLTINNTSGVNVKLCEVDIMT